MPTQLFITNTANANLGQRLRELISTSREMRALVGFFYFSGVKVLYAGNSRTLPETSPCRTSFDARLWTVAAAHFRAAG